jgi:hypothetical protein
MTTPKANLLALAEREEDAALGQPALSGKDGE